MSENEITPHFMTRSDVATEETNEIFLLSRAELEFLKGTKTVNPNYERVLLHRIHKKLDSFRDNVLPVLWRNHKTASWVENITENCNRITNFSNDATKPAKLQNSLFSQNSGRCVVGRPGLEPGTFCVSGRCPTKLDDRPISGFLVKA